MAVSLDLNSAPPAEEARPPGPALRLPRQPWKWLLGGRSPLGWAVLGGESTEWTPMMLCPGLKGRETVGEACPGRGRGGRCPPCLSLLGVLPVPLLGTRLQDTRELTSFKTSHSPAPPPVGAPPPPWRSHAPARGLNAPARGLSPPSRPPSSPPGRSHGPCLDRGFSAKLSEVCLEVPAACLVPALPAWALLALVNSWLHLQG